jgi:hypothetical protein
MPRAAVHRNAEIDHSAPGTIVARLGSRRTVAEVPLTGLSFFMPGW